MIIEGPFLINLTFKASNEVVSHRRPVGQIPNQPSNPGKPGPDNTLPSAETSGKGSAAWPKSHLCWNQKATGIYKRGAS